MSFWKNLFGDDTAPKTRLWPQWYVDENDNLSPEELLRQRFIYTRVFKINNDSDYKQYGRHSYIYAAMVPSDYNDGEYRLYTFTFNKGDTYTNEDGGGRDDAKSALERLVAFEKKMIAHGNTPLDGTTNNLREFAATQGLYINKDEKVFHVDANGLLNTGVEIARGAAQAFYVAAGTKAPTSSWEWFYERYIDSMGLRFQGAVDALRADPSYLFAIDRSDKLINGARQLQNTIRSGGYSTQRDALNYAPQMGGDSLISHMDAQSRVLFEYAYNMTRLVAVLRAGSTIVDQHDDFNKDGSVNQQKINLLKTARLAAATIMENVFQMMPQERQAITDVMLRGKDPREAVTPLEVLFTAFPPLSLPAPQSSKPRL